MSINLGVSFFPKLKLGIFISGASMDLRKFLFNETFRLDILEESVFWINIIFVICVCFFTSSAKSALSTTIVANFPVMTFWGGFFEFLFVMIFHPKHFSASLFEFHNLGTIEFRFKLSIFCLRDTCKIKKEDSKKILSRRILLRKAIMLK